MRASFTLKGKGFVRIKINGSEYKIGDLVQQWKIDSGVDDLMKYSALVGKEFEKSTGLYEILYSGETTRQARSATESDLKDKASKNRIDDMKRQVEAASSTLLSKMIFAARYLHPPEDIAKLFGPTAGAIWATLAPPEIAAQEQTQRQQAIAQQIQLATQQIMRMPPPIVQPGMLPPPMPTPPTAAEVDEMLGPEQFVSMEEWVNEADREIEAGSMRRVDHNAQIDNMNIFFNQTAAIVSALPGGAQFVAAAAVDFTRLNRYSADMQQAALEFQKISMLAPPPLPAAPPEKGTKDPGPNAGKK